MAHFWRGKIDSEEQANEIVRWTGWLFISLAMFPMIESRSVLAAANIAMAISIVAMLLLWARSRFAAGVLFVLALFVTIVALMLAVFAAWYDARTNSYGGSSIAWLLVTSWWALLSLLTWRALMATIAWHRLSRSRSSSDATRTAERIRPLGPPWIM